MKKFSKEIGENIPQQPKPVDKDLSPDEELKLKLHVLFKKYIKISTLNMVDTPFAYQKVDVAKIDGENDFINAVLYQIKNYSNKSTKKVVESLKYKINDWETIDGVLESIEEPNKDIEPYVMKLRKLYNLYKSNIDMFYKIIEKSIDSIDENGRRLRKEAADYLGKNELPKDVMDKISKMYDKN